MLVHRLLLVGVFCLLGLCRPCDAQSTDASDAVALHGEYRKGNRGIQIAAVGSEEYRVLFYNGGLPGVDWDFGPIQIMEMDRDEVQDLIEGAERVDRESDTLGAKPPEGAIVLFDGTPSSLESHWQPGAKLVEDNLLSAGCTTLDHFRDYRLHLEFRTPFQPDANGQGRGNSGLYHQGRYETQVLDSFGFENENNSCGAIYGVRAADFNACLPPGHWQTYDVEFTAARWDAEGRKTGDAKLTVWLNGYRIHGEVAVPGPTTAAPWKEASQPGPLYLQDHGNPVVYRNIWLVPIDAEAIALRPRVPGYERLAASSSRVDDMQLNGRLLISELGCSACHDAGRLATKPEKKEAPILDQAGSRLRPGFVAAMLDDVHRSKIGTTMPDMLHGLGGAERQETIEALAAFVESKGKSRRPSRVDKESSKRGEVLFSSIGCAVCHGFPDGRGVTSTSIAFPDMSKKYTIEGMASFLKQPHSVRPSGRMPGMHLDDKEARDLASYLLPMPAPEPWQSNLRYQVYHGNWNKLPDFDRLEPVESGTSDGLDLSVAGRTNDFGIRFDGFLLVQQSGTYRFFLGSDDGSRLYVDDELVVNVDGVHPHQTESGAMALDEGVHRIRVEYMQGGGEWTLELQWESESVARQAIDGWLQLDYETPAGEEQNALTAELLERGKVAFQTLGCVNCHAMTGLEVPHQASQRPPAMDRLRWDQGCLAERPSPKSPDYRLSVFQKEAIRTALREITQGIPIPPSQHSKFIMTQLNCISCHQRDGWGGPESDKLALFRSTIPEMGDEGRLPPSLNGVGDKLNDRFLDRVLTEGVRHRDYMLVRMPQFGGAPHSLAEHWKAMDRPSDDRLPEAPDQVEDRRIAAGRQLVGTKGLACAQCHSFGKERALGIQAINMLSMPDRLRPEWFYRYLLEPTRYRPGTRMPASFPEGASVLKTVYDGHADHQIHAMWQYLQQGESAAIPEGLQRGQMVLEPIDRPILYRNFLEGLSPRGIAVGYPGGLNIAWDAETMSLAKAWQGQFIDASMHWRDRGVGRQRPLGDLILDLEKVAPVAVLAMPETPWPSPQEASQEFRFQGYQLDRDGVPTFRYRSSRVEVRDRSDLDRSDKSLLGLKRTLWIEPSSDGPLWVRLAEGGSVERLSETTWRVDQRYQISLDSELSSKAVLRQASGDRRELLLPVTVEGDPSVKSSVKIEFVIRW